MEVRPHRGSRAVTGLSFALELKYHDMTTLTPVACEGSALLPGTKQQQFRLFSPASLFYISVSTTVRIGIQKGCDIYDVKGGREGGRAGGGGWEELKLI